MFYIYYFVNLTKTINNDSSFKIVIKLKLKESHKKYTLKGAGGIVDGKTDGLILSPKPVLEWLKLGVPARNMCNYLPSKFESFRKHTLSSSWTSWTGGILTGKIML